jgi:tight adherence protein C
MLSASSKLTLITIGFALVIGICVSVIIGMIGKRVANVPKENRNYKDSPPLAFQCLWFPIQIISHFLNPLLSENRQTQSMNQLRKAGLDYAIIPSQYIAARMIYGGIITLITCWVVTSFNPKVSSATLLSIAIVSGIVGYAYLGIWVNDRIHIRKNQLLKALPFYLDIMTLCIEAGLNLQGAIHQAVLKGPEGILRDEFQRVLRDIRAGKTRSESLRMLSQRVNEPNITSLTSALIQAEQMGMNLAPILRTQSDQRRTERFLRAEKLAMEAPVKMLFPLIAFIFPCTFVVLFFPIVMKFMNVGV